MLDDDSDGDEWIAQVPSMEKAKAEALPQARAVNVGPRTGPGPGTGLGTGTGSGSLWPLYLRNVCR